jgi:hypothetical protein
MNSRDTAHVPAPDPDAFWDFEPGQARTVSVGSPTMSLKFLRSERTRAQFECAVDGTVLVDWLELDRPCVALRFADDSPAVTFTLRKVERLKVFLQVTASDRLYVARRE